MANRITTTFDFAERGAGLKKIKADVQGVDGAWNKAKTSAKSAYAEFANNRAAQAAVAGIALKIGHDAVQAASALQESANAVNTTFDETSDGIRQLAQDSVDSYGLSERAFNQLAVAFSGFAQQVAGEGGDVVATVDAMATRVADFASVHDLELADAMTKFQSALAGETEAVRRYGIDVSAAAVKTFAYANGIADAGDELTEAEKVQARYGLLMQETTQWSGDFAATMDSQANAARRLAAENENAQATLGDALLPVTEAATGAMIELASAVDQVDRAIQGVSGGSMDLGSTLGAAVSDILLGNQYMSAAADKLWENTDATKAYDDALTLTNDERERSIDILNGVAGRMTESERATVMASEAMRDQARAGNHVATVMADVERRQEAAAAATERHRQAMSDLFDEVQNNLSSLFDYEDATLELQNAAEDYTAQLEAEASSAEQSDRTKRDLRQTEIDLANQALETARAYAQNQGAIEGTTAFAILQRQELERLSGQFPELRDEIAQFISELNRIPAVKTVSLILQRNSVNSALSRTTGGTVRVDEFGNLKSVGMGATGGIVTRPTLSVIGEAGPEAVVPLNSMPGASPLPRSVGGGVSIGQVVVQAPAGANADEFGRLVREAIRRETRWSGPVSGWSAA